ncbi:MAG: hypothetical protein ACI89W_001668 [Gammaproteobacteria bacterium]|jgi:hypothetical protein
MYCVNFKNMGCVFILMSLIKAIDNNIGYRQNLIKMLASQLVHKNIG